MKIRQGFVSNSSSSSFLIYGIEITDEINELTFSEELANMLISDYKKKMERYKERNLEKIAQQYSEDIEILQKKKDSGNFDLSGFDEVFEDLVYFVNLEYYNVMDCVHYIGESPHRADDNITFGEWKQNIRDKVKQLFPDINDNNFSWCEECWRDG